METESEEDKRHCVIRELRGASVWREKKRWNRMKEADVDDAQLKLMI